MRATKWLHRSKKDFTPEMLKAKPVLNLIEETTAVLSKAVTFGIGDTEVNAEFTKNLTENIYVFSGFKTFHEMKEAANMLVDDKGNRKPFNQYLNDIQTINSTYNKQYLGAEYQFTTSSAQMAAKWGELSEDEERYNLQYRTAGDGKVRKAHAALEGITLPASDPFWNEFYPPNGFGCRCNAVKVRKSKYPQSDSSDSAKKGKEATAGKHAEMFRFNPGKKQAAYPAYNSYTIKSCSTCSDTGFKLAKTPKNELCAACVVIRGLKDKRKG